MISFEQMGNGRWRWSYREPGRKPVLSSNEDHDTLEEARVSAAAAYPGVSMSPPEGARQKPPGTGERGIARTIARWLTPVVVLLAWSRSKRR